MKQAKPSLCMLSADVFAGHTSKRASFLSTQFEVTVAGFSRFNKNRDEVRSLNYATSCVSEVKDKQYLNRIADYLKLLSTLRNHGPEFVWARGADMHLVALLFFLIRRRRVKLLSEISDVYAISYAKPYSALWRRWERWLYGNATLVFATSPAFFNFYKIPSQKQVLWENFSELPEAQGGVQKSFRAKADSFAQGKQFVLVWAGYLRCRYTIENMAAMVKSLQGKVVFRLHGYPNGGDVDMELIEQLTGSNPWMQYYGPYPFGTAQQAIYTNAHFTIASERGLHNLDSTLCLSNRIYESAKYATPSIALKPGAIADYIVSHQLGRSFEDMKSLTDFFSHLTWADYVALFEQCAFKDFELYEQEAKAVVRSAINKLLINESQVVTS